jgi:hypothetical protein
VGAVEVSAPQADFRDQLSERFGGGTMLGPVSRRPRRWSARLAALLKPVMSRGPARSRQAVPVVAEGPDVRRRSGGWCN